MEQSSQEEIWKDIIGYEGLYQVSSFGNIKRLPRYVNNPSGSKTLLKERISKKSVSRMGYEYIDLSYLSINRKHFVHRLLAIAFLPNPENKSDVNHIDGNRLNNHISNLQWCTRTENELHKVNTLNKNPTKNFGNREVSDTVIRYNNKNIYGLKLQRLFKRFMDGEVIKVDHLSIVDRQRFYSNVCELKNRFGVPVKTKRLKGLPSYKIYFLNE